MTVVTFKSTHSAMVAQKQLSGVVDFVVMPTPRQISASCGIALKIGEEDAQQVGALLAKTLGEMFAVHDLS